MVTNTWCIIMVDLNLKRLREAVKKLKEIQRQGQGATAPFRFLLKDANILVEPRYTDYAIIIETALSHFHKSYMDALLELLEPIVGTKLYWRIEIAHYHIKGKITLSVIMASKEA